MNGKALADMASGPDWVFYIVVALLAAASMYIFTALTLVNCVIMTILGNTICKKK